VGSMAMDWGWLSAGCGVKSDAQPIPQVGWWPGQCIRIVRRGMHMLCSRREDGAEFARLQLCFSPSSAWPTAQEAKKGRLIGELMCTGMGVD